ncbi:MAG: CPXCG motif-containing cysteine-rich protein [Pseudomonadota bacterium]
MRELHEQQADCPYCGEPIDLVIDLSAGTSDYIEDCQVCCRPMHIYVSMSGDWLDSVTVLSEDQ